MMKLLPLFVVLARHLKFQNVKRGNWEAHLEWEEANWHYVIAREEKEESLSQEEINWLNSWLSEEK